MMIRLALKEVEIQITQPVFNLQVVYQIMKVKFIVAGNSGDKVMYGFGSGKRGQLGISEDKIKLVSVPVVCSGFENAEVVDILANGDQSAALSGEMDFLHLVCNVETVHITL